MSFRSAWRYAAKTSPTTSPTLPPKEVVNSGAPSEPTLVVTNSRPPSTHDPKTDKPVSNSQDASAEQRPENGIQTRIEDAPKQDVEPTAPTPKTRESEEVGTMEQSKKEASLQDGRWFSWWGSVKSEAPAPAKDLSDKVATNGERPKSAPEPPTTESTPSTSALPVEQVPTSPASLPSQPVDIRTLPTTSETSSGSYLAWIWSSRSPPKSTASDLEKTAVDTSTANEDTIKPPAATEEIATPRPPASTQNPLITTLPQTRSSWMTFWSRSDSMPDLKRTDGPETMQVPGDIDSQGRPLKEQKTKDDMSVDIPTAEANANIKSKKPTHTPSISMSEVPCTPTKPPASPISSPTKPETPSKATPSKKDKSKSKTVMPPPPNHVLPEFETVYPTLPRKEGFLSRVTRAILPSMNSSYTVLPGAVHPYPCRCPPPPIRKAVAIGIHGFFPLRILRSVLGEPTGTSVKFATLASEAIHRYSEKHYGSARDIEVVKIALEGEGTVSARVGLLWRNLAGKKEWMDHIREADLILVACHSQGSPVGAGIMAKLVEEGIVVERTRLGLLCVAGIHLGPAIDVGQRVVIKAYNAIESEAARELYDFQDSDSKVSRKYVEGIFLCWIHLMIALRTILAHDTRVTLIGSIDDHLVPMYSSTFSTAYHGAIYRAVFIDGRIHQNDFLARLVAFALRLRNEGWRDHGVMNELSSALMGNFYTGEGHSRIYDEPAVYE